MSENQSPAPENDSQIMNRCESPIAGTENIASNDVNREPLQDSGSAVDSETDAEKIFVEPRQSGNDLGIAPVETTCTPLEVQRSEIATPAENAMIAMFDATDMGDSAWKEVESQYGISISAWQNDNRANVKETLNRFAQLLKDKAPLTGSLFDSFRQDKSGQPDVQQKAFEVDVASDDREIWFLGDIHSDLLALESALCFLKRRPKPVSYVFLGDLFDDGPHGAETVLRVMKLILDDPSAVTVIAGNHDEALGYLNEKEEFHSSVSPCEFSEWLNAPAQKNDPLAKQLGELTIEFFRRCPRALFFRDGLLVAHGGVPLGDKWDSFKDRNDLNHPDCLQDFVWTRPHHRRKRTIPNRSKKGAGLGHEDFSDFCGHAEKLFEFPVRWMIRGHDHVDTEKRFVSFDAYRRHPLLTINTLCYRLYRENLGDYVRVPCIAKYVRNQLPEIHCLRIPADLVRRVYPEPSSDD